MSKLIAVFGATGAQGGTVARNLLKKGFKVRGITRNPNSEKAEALRKLGAEVVKGNLDDNDSVRQVVEGTAGVFLVTNFWEGMDREKEISQGKRVTDACKTANVKHLIFSGLELVKEITGTPCPHFDGKGEIEKYIEASGVPFTSVRIPYYFENFSNPLFGPQKQEDGSYNLVIGMKGGMDGISVEDLGPVIVSLFFSDTYLGKKIGLSGDKLTPTEYMEILSKATGKTYRAVCLPWEEYSKLPFPPAEDLGAMFNFYENYNPDRDIKITQQLNPDVRSFKQWVNENKDKF